MWKGMLGIGVLLAGCQSGSKVGRIVGDPGERQLLIESLGIHSLSEDVAALRAQLSVHIAATPSIEEVTHLGQRQMALQAQQGELAAVHARMDERLETIRKDALTFFGGRLEEAEKEQALLRTEVARILAELDAEAELRASLLNGMRRRLLADVADATESMERMRASVNLWEELDAAIAESYRRLGIGSDLDDRMKGALERVRGLIPRGAEPPASPTEASMATND